MKCINTNRDDIALEERRLFKGFCPLFTYSVNDYSRIIFGLGVEVTVKKSK